MTAGELRGPDLAPDPVEQFRRWYADAVRAGMPEPDAMTLATAAPDGSPSARTVLLKGVGARGFAFYTNHASRKGRELAANPGVALVFLWEAPQRQVCVRGRVSRLPDDESDAYFDSRPRDSQLGAWASRQSEVLTGREELEERLREAQERFAGGPVPRPPFWGGYVVAPAEVEFWQGRPNRLHDRFRYRRDEAGDWVVERLSP
ncbi:pyridoxamine 5'-phosphate oxidase [soil metagenome]